MNADLVVKAIAGIGQCAEADLPVALEELATSLGYKHAAIVEAQKEARGWVPGKTICRSPEFSRSCRSVVDALCQGTDPVRLITIGEGLEMTSSVKETRTFSAAGVHLEQLCVPGEKTLLLLVTDDRTVKLSDLEIRLLSTVGTLVSRALSSKTAPADAQAQAQDRIEMVSHDLKNPLGVILSWTSVLLESDATTEAAADQRRALVAIRQNSLFMLELIRDLLDSVSIEGGQMTMTPARCDLRQLVRDSVARHEVPATAKAIRIATEVPDVRVEVVVDAGKIGQVLDNLVTNALKFSRSGTQVTVGVDASPGEARIRVADQGLGIEPDEVSCLFRKFGTTTTRATKGERSTGLGLYIVDHMVRLHGGAVEVESKPGAGSTFTVRLPTVR